MVDPIALWGALTGTTGLGVAVRREFMASRRRLRVERGWHFATSKDGDEIIDVWVYVMAWNTGGRALSLEHCGFSWLSEGDVKTFERQQGLKMDPGARLWNEHRAEINMLGVDAIEVSPDGPTVKVMTRIGPLLALGLDPLGDDVAPFVVTAAERYWWGRPGPLLPRIPADVSREHVAEALARIRDEAERPTGDGHLYGLPRFVPRGLEPES